MSSIAVYPVGRHLINADDKIEMIAGARAEERYYNEYGQECSEYGYSTSTIIINEDGDIVHDFGHTIHYVSDFGVGDLVHKVGNQLRLAAWTDGPPYQYDEYGNIVFSTSYLNIYSLGGNYNPSTMATYTQPAGFTNPYPNPSRNTVTLPYTLQPGETSQLRVFNMNGQLLETFHIGSDFDKILLNVSNYPKGTYIYTYNGVSKKFVVQ
ncbi:MAG: T9SS type A sorting domain-containing protein [Bacteroidales bacterium]|nr:T9SS type A sorting domain-containing protein [Bacteroidales bacterium]